MRISHEAIYQSLFIEGRGALKRELVSCLRTGRALRQPRARSQNKPQGHVTADVVLSKRPAEAADRAVPGHWEGDLINRHGPVRDRHRDRTQQPLHAASAPAQTRRVGHDAAGEERSIAGRIWC